MYVLMLFEDSLDSHIKTINFYFWEVGLFLAGVRDKC
jgi:hypothetical protein